MFLRIGAVRSLTTGEIVVTNTGSGEIRFYDSAGIYLESIGRIGQGPGEFSPVASMRICEQPDGSILVSDDNRRRFHTIGQDHQYIDTVQFSESGSGVPWPAGCFDNGSWLLHTSGQRTQQGQLSWRVHELLVGGPDGFLVRTGIQYDGQLHWEEDRRLGLLPIPFSMEPFFTTSGSDIILGRGPAELEYRGPDAELKRVVRIATFDRVPAREAVGEIANFWLTRDLDPEFLSMLARFFKRDLPMPEHVPIFQGILTDAHGFLWVERFRMPGDTVSIREVFDTQGSWLGTIEFPARFQVHAIDRGRMIGVHTDSVGIESVRIYRLVGRGSA
jgi:hypothetical protein